MFSRKINGIPLAIYLYMRFDIEHNVSSLARGLKKRGLLVSGVSVQALAQAFEINELTIKKHLDQLCRDGWVKLERNKGDVFYKLGIIEDNKCKWLVDAPEKKHSISYQVKKAARERKKRKDSLRSVNKGLSYEAKKALAKRSMKGVFRTQSNGKTILKLFFNRYSDVMNDSFPIPENELDRQKFYSRQRAFANRFVEYCDNDVNFAIELMDYTFKNWKEVKKALGWTGIPSMSLFSTAAFVKKLKGYKKLGISRARGRKNDTGRRYDKEKSRHDPSEGF